VTNEDLAYVGLLVGGQVKTFCHVLGFEDNSTGSPHQINKSDLVHNAETFSQKAEKNKKILY